jgi:hypothetical protein
MNTYTIECARRFAGFLVSRGFDFYADSLRMNLRYGIDGCLCLSVCMSVLYVCMYVTKLHALQTGKNIPLDNRNRYAKRRRKIPSFWPPVAILNF